MPLDLAGCICRIQKSRNLRKQFQYFPYSGMFSSRFHHEKKKTVQNWALTIIYLSVFWWKQTDRCILTGELIGPSDLPERVLKRVSQSSAWYRRYQMKTIFQRMISILGTLPKRLLAHHDQISNFHGCGSIDQREWMGNGTYITWYNALALGKKSDKRH